jgi:hypothetical protein
MVAPSLYSPDPSAVTLPEDPKVAEELADLQKAVGELAEKVSQRRQKSIESDIADSTFQLDSVRPNLTSSTSSSNGPPPTDFPNVASSASVGGLIESFSILPSLKTQCLRLNQLCDRSLRVAEGFFNGPPSGTEEVLRDVAGVDGVAAEARAKRARVVSALSRQFR